MTEKRENLHFHIYLAIILYAMLPRVQVSTFSPYLNTLFEVKANAVPYIVFFLFFITIQNIHFNKFKTLNLNHMIFLIYALYILSNSLLFVVLAFV